MFAINVGIVSDLFSKIHLKVLRNSTDFQLYDSEFRIDDVFCKALLDQELISYRYSFCCSSFCSSCW